MKFDKPIALAADHGGYELKEAIKAHLDELGVAYTDFGTDSTASVDYPDFAAKGCKAVQDGSCALVILCCGTGVGMSMCANKMKGIRACCCSDTFSAEFTRRHNNANALCLGGRVVGAGLGCQIVDAFLNAEFEGGRHQMRIDKMMALENHSVSHCLHGRLNIFKMQGDRTMSVVEIVDHPLIQHKISLLRDRNTGTKEFRDLVSEIAMLLCYEATRDLPTEEVEVETPVALARTKVLAGRKLALVPILRAGLGMVDGLLNLIPAAKVGHIGMYRNEETLEPVEYYCKLPNDINEREVFVLDPMLATGGSACDAIGQIKKRGAKHIKFIGLVAAPQGLKALHEAHPDVDIYVGALDEKLNDNGYIVPGLGDAGDRIFGTK